MNKKLQELPNIGSKLAERLEAVGIETPDKLVALGSVEAVIRINDSLNEGCYNCLYALEGAVRGIRWHAISAEDRSTLKSKLDNAYLSKHE